VGVSCIIPLCPLCVIDDPDEFHPKLMEDRWRAVSGGYGRDDRIHFEAKAGKINNGYHGANLDGLMEFALLLRVVTLSVAKFPLSMCAAKVLSTIWMLRYFN
jgi:hypothetical protein